MTSKKLNLGCGDKLINGYINVDLVTERAGVTPDVNCDIRKLTVFDTDYADEILAVHVIEHFWRWEVEDILAEWVRVLKPNGKLILECPNLISACEEFLKDPDASKKFLSIGDASYDQNLPKEEIASLGVLANAIFNLWESIAKF